MDGRGSARPVFSDFGSLICGEQAAARARCVDREALSHTKVFTSVWDANDRRVFVGRINLRVPDDNNTDLCVCVCGIIFANECLRTAV